ncbi:hypothetical protein [Sulfuracidifex tepidarius]|uniref:hypothetical protein n=1 Tax=Sulfuracidifex tepidarius TaxID=1294262 RepID=UPI0011F208B7|nr:hypothetical protein [Sulfuracidifex tepidarius]
MSIRLFSLLYITFFLVKYFYLDVSSFLTTTSLYTPSFFLYTYYNFTFSSLVFTAILVAILISLRRFEVTFMALAYVIFQVLFLLYPNVIFLLASYLSVTAIYLILASISTGLSRYTWAISSLAFPLSFLNGYFQLLLIPSVIGAFFSYRTST